MSNSVPTVCPLCNLEEVFSARQQHVDSGVSYSLYMCPTCLAWFWWPLKNPGASWYERDERYADRNSDPILEPNEKHVGVIRFLEPLRGSVLDIGCGVGNFLAHAQKKGWKGWGIDFDHDAIEAGRNTFGLENLEVSDLATFAQSHQSLRFELVTFFDVIEHLDDHGTFFKDIERILMPNGYIGLSMPYRHGWRWLMPYDVPPRHLTRWDEQSLEKFLNQNGYEIKYVKRLHASFYYLVMKLRFKYGAWTSIGMVKKIKDTTRSSSGIARESEGSVPGRVRMVQALAKAKDMIIFGLPAALLWLVLLTTRKRYTDFYVVAQAK